MQSRASYGIWKFAPALRLPLPVHEQGRIAGVAIFNNNGRLGVGVCATCVDEASGTGTCVWRLI